MLADVALWCAIFVELAENRQRTGVRRIVIRWMGAHHSPGLDAVMIEVTALGTGTVVVMVVTVAALFLSLTQHKYSALLLLASSFGGIVLNGVLKLGFDRPRPSIFVPAVHTVSSHSSGTHERRDRLLDRRVSCRATPHTAVGAVAGDDRRIHSHRADFIQPDVSRRALSV